MGLWLCRERPRSIAKLGNTSSVYNIACAFEVPGIIQPACGIKGHDGRGILINYVVVLGGRTPPFMYLGMTVSKRKATGAAMIRCGNVIPMNISRIGDEVSVIN